ncbi:serpin family protein [Halalkalicoccus ordinarius]|uniref:serpin family protein n=1 Tax=Halalkalicoccus ordinarius TaxID=3116651 RepID=UPI00300E7D1F
MDRRTLLLSGAALALAGCLGSGSGGSGGPGTDPDAEPTTDLDVSEETLESLVEGNTRFAFDLYDYLRGSETGNLLASPYSVSVALAMTYAGAREETETQIAEAMRFSLEEEIHPAFAALYHELDARSEVETDDEESDPFELATANAAWGLESYPYREEYLELVERYYGAGFRTVDFEGDPEGAREEINDWVAGRTEERIDDLLPEGSIDELTRLVLTNALFFRATWAEPFEEERTEDAPFTALDGATEDVPIMRRDGSFPYTEVGGHQVIDLPYVGEEVGMVVVLPAEGEFERIEAGLDVGRFSTLDDALEPREGTIALPRFGFESGFALEEALSALGMEVAFDEREANFDGIAPLEELDGNLYVDDVYHDTFIAVDEEGTEAAAATGVVIREESAPADPFEMIVDRPFLFAIRDRPTGSVLFLGRVVDAVAAQ